MEHPDLAWGPEQLDIRPRNTKNKLNISNNCGADLVHDDGVRVSDASAGAVHLSALLPVSRLGHEAVGPPDLITHRDRGHQGHRDTQTQRPHGHRDYQLLQITCYPPSS